MSTYDLGTLSSNGSPVTRNGYSLSTSDTTDVFKFRLGTADDINGSLTRISSGDDADLRIYRDTNNNGVLDSSDRSFGVVGSSTRGSNYDDAVNVASQSVGTYFAEVSRYSSSSGNVSYNLALSTADPSNLLATENLVGDLSGDRNFSGRIDNSNTSELYRFSIGRGEAVNLNLTGLTADLDIRLIQDTNNNRIVDSGEVLLSSTRGSTSTDTISINDTGEYFLQVYQYSNNASNYNLNFDYFTTGAA